MIQISSLYREKILEHYKNPHNYGDLDEANLEKQGENPQCGDELTVQASIVDGQVQALQFTGDGCALSVAAASMVTDELQDADLQELKNVSDEHVFELLGLAKDDVSPMRYKCVLLARDTLQQLAADYEA